MAESPPFTPTMSGEEAEHIRTWHERAYAELKRSDKSVIEYLGLRLLVPPNVFPPTPMSDLFGRLVLAEVRETDRVLDMGTGSGSNAILAASRAPDVLAVDISPTAVECARDNAEANGVSHHVEVRRSDVFDDVDGSFDLVIFDPPFRWFAPRDQLEATITDENYRALTRFMREVPKRLRPGGRVLLTFGTSGDLDYLLSLVDASGLHCQVLDERSLEKDGMSVSYFVYRLQQRTA